MFVFLIITILVSAFLFANSDSKEKSVFGYRFYNVLTPSMTPTIPVGSMVFVKMVDTTELTEGDIITYSTSVDGSIVLTHRINRILSSEDGLHFMTKGDANEVEDLEPVSAAEVIGRVNLIIPYLGSIMAYIQGNLILVIASIIGLILIGELISYGIKSHKSKE